MKRTIINSLVIGLSASLLSACGGGDAQGTDAQATLRASTTVCYATWNSATVYTGGATASYNGVNYTAAYWTQGQNPATNSGAAGSGQPWTVSGTCGTTPTPTPTPTGGKEVGSYFAQWGVYGRDYEVANIEASGTANKLTFINYAFGNIYTKNGGYECDMITKAEPGATNPSAPDAGTGGDADADYIRTPKRTVDGLAIPWDAKLSGSFAQLKKLKAMHPGLKVFISLGGWSWSKNFSAAAASDALRKQMVSSCINLYIKGNLPVKDGRGGTASAAGVFDGIDVDWEFPGGGGQPYNGVSTADKQNFTLLMAELRKQLDAQGTVDNKHYYLTAAISAGKEKIDFTEPAKYAQYMDWVNVMTYDFHGGWAPTGPTNFNAHLYADPADPGNATEREYVGDKAIKYLIAQGFPANKLLLGIPFYGRGWTGVAAGPNGNGLYQSATGAAPGMYEAGINDYKVLMNKSGNRYYHPITKQLYLYTGSGGEWWSYDDATVIATKMQYVKAQGLRGAFSWSLDGDANGALAAEVWKVRQ